jgi:hypothetical protein
MSFEYDIFISYGHMDDEDPAGDEKGWVDLLVERLPIAIGSIRGDKPRVWRDERSLRGNHKLDAAIREGVTRSLLLVPVVSPRYVRSDWCRTELEAFCNAVPPPGADACSFSTRIFKVSKSALRYPHLRDKEPEMLREMIGYPFFDRESFEEFSPDTGPGKDRRYWSALNRLAEDISDKLVALKEGAEAPRPEPAPIVINTRDHADGGGPAVTPAVVAGGAKLVYLAETTGDLMKEHELVSDELKQRGFGVLPEKKLPLDERRKTEEAVREALARCVLSVHLIGARYGSPPEDDESSVVCIQEKLAAERRAANPAFQRLIWLPPGLGTPALQIKAERQKEYVAALQARVTAGTELWQTTIEDLKTRVVEKLTPAKAAPVRARRRQKAKRVYLICENRDRSFVLPIRQYLLEEFEVITWLDQEADSKLMEYHRKNLKECDAALIYYGNGDEPWVRKNIEDLEKALGYDRDDDWSASAVYVGAPPDDWKQGFYTHDVDYVIRNLAGFNPDDLREFVSAVRTAEGGQP